MQWHMGLVPPGVLLYPRCELQHLAKVPALLALCHRELITSGAGAIEVDLLIAECTKAHNWWRHSCSVSVVSVNVPLLSV